MKPNLLHAIRGDILSELDVLVIVNCLVAKFPATSEVGDVLLDCALALDGYITYDAPTLDDIPRFEEREYDRQTQLEAA